MYLVNEKLKNIKYDENMPVNRKNKTFFSAAKNAINGIIHAFKTERNLRIDYIIGVLVFAFSLFFDFTKTEYICLILTIGFVIFAEMINSTVEYIVDLITEEYNLKAKAAKDIAAGAVLVSSGISVIIAYFLFYDKISQASTKLLTAVLSSKIHILFTILFALVILTVILKGIFSKTRNYVKSFPSARVSLSFALSTYLFVITKSFVVGGVAFFLSFLVTSMKHENDKASFLHILFSAMLGILIVLIVYQLTFFKPIFENIRINLWP